MAQPAASLWIEIGAKIDKLQKGMDGATGTLIKAERNITRTMNKINTVINAALVIGGVVAIKKFSEALSNLAEQGEKLGSIEEGFKRLGGTTGAIDDARKATIGLVNSFDLMQAANEGLVAGIPGFNENFAKIAELGARVANTLGTDTAGAIKQVTDALKSGKSQALQNVGILVDAEKVYGKFGNELTTVERKALLMNAAMKALPDAIKRFAEVTDSAANAQQAVKTAMQEVIGQAAIAINSNVALTRAYRELELAIQKIDFRELAKAAAEFFATIIHWSSQALPPIIQWVKEMIGGFNILFGQGLAAQADRLAIKIAAIQDELEGKGGNRFLGMFRSNEEFDKRQVELRAELETTLGEYNKITAEIAKQNKLLETQANIVVPPPISVQFLADAERRQRESIEKLAKLKEDKDAKAAEKAAEKYQEEMARAYEESLASWTDAFRKAIDGNSQSLTESLKEILVGFAGALAASISAGVNSGLTGNGLEGIGQSLGQMISGPGGLDRLANIFGFGQTTAEAHAAGIQGPGLPDGSFPSGGSGAGIAAGAAAAIQTITAAFNAKDIDKKFGDNRGTGAAVGTGLGAGIGSLAGPAGTMIGSQLGSVIGGLIGKMFGRGAQDPQTQARHAFANFIEDSFKKLKTIAFVDAQGAFRTFNSQILDFVEGKSSRFNIPDWGKKMEEWGDKAKTTFLGLGAGLKEVLGITEDVGAQIGFLLGENLGGSIDNARLLVYQLGLSLQDMEDALVKSGLSGQMSWHEVEVAIQGVNEAFKPGIEAVGDLQGAVEELTGSGGRGAAAIKAVKDIAVEALEAGATTLADLPRVLAEDGVTQETINAIMGAIEQRGIKTLEELASVSDRVGGGIVADIESNSQIMAKTWAEMAETIKGVQEQLASLPDKLNTDVTINVKANITDEAQGAIDAINQGGNAINVNTKAFANGGILTSRSRIGNGIAGERGAEAILPLKTMPNGRMGVEAFGAGRGGSPTLIINAQGASPGVENDIRAEIEAMGQEAVSRAIQAVQDMAGRGGRYADY